MITRREFLKTAALAGPASVLGTHPRPVSAEPPPETTIRLTQSPIICVAPQYLAEALLRAEGFAEVRYVKNVPGGASRALASGEADAAWHSPRHSSSTLMVEHRSFFWQESTPDAGSSSERMTSAQFAISRRGGSRC